MKKGTIKIIFGAVITILIVYALFNIDLFPLTSYGPITTKVVDAETGEPIEGAVVMVEWTKTKGMPGMSSHYSYKVEEVITDSEGIAKLAGIPNEKAALDVVAVYKKGYVLWSDHNVFAGSRMLTVFEWKDNIVFEMARFKPEYSYDKHTSFIHSAIRSGSGSKNTIKEAYYWEEQKALEERKKRQKKYRGIYSKERDKRRRK